MTTTLELPTGTSAGSRAPRQPVAGHLGAVYRLANHLDATLAMTEDLLQHVLDVPPLAPGDATKAIATRNAAIGACARSARALELGIIARLLQARARAIDVRALHPKFEPLIALFIGGTAPLADAAAGQNGGLGDVSVTALQDGTEVLAFLRSRGVVADTTVSLAALTNLGVTEDYLLAATIHLGTLMDMVAQFLDSLDLAFDLYGEEGVAG